MALFSNLRACSILGKMLIRATVQEASRREIHRYTRATMDEIIRRQKKAKPLPIEKTRRSNYIEWNFNAEIYAFGKRLGEEFRIELLLQSFVHRSYIQKEKMKQEEVGIDTPSLSLKDNEQQAGLGEAIVSKETKRFLTANWPRLPLEGINAVHNFVLSDVNLGNIAKNLGATELILSADYPVETSTLAKTLKAMVSALAESQSIERANKFVREIILSTLAEKDIDDIYEISNPLEVLAGILERNGQGEPEPRIIGQSAMNEILASYTVGIYSDKQIIGQGPGETVDTAVTMAARDALKKMFGIHNSSRPLSFDDTVTSAPTSTPLRISSWSSSAFKQAS